LKFGGNRSTYKVKNQTSLLATEECEDSASSSVKFMISTSLSDSYSVADSFSIVDLVILPPDLSVSNGLILKDSNGVVPLLLFLLAICTVKFNGSFNIPCSARSREPDPMRCPFVFSFFGSYRLNSSGFYMSVNMDIHTKPIPV
jgi:hypothetical protein